MKTFSELKTGDYIWNGPDDKLCIKAVINTQDGGKSFEVNTTDQEQPKRSWINVSRQQLEKTMIRDGKVHRTYYSSRLVAAKQEKMKLIGYAKKLEFRIARNVDELERVKKEIKKIKEIEKSPQPQD